MGKGELEGKANGFYGINGEFILDSFTLTNGQEPELTDAQKTIISRKGDERHAEAQAELREHQREQNRDIQIEARS
jgi:hypothetical protein